MTRWKYFLTDKSATQRPKVRRAFSALMLSVAAAASSGCTALTQPIDGVPADRLPPQFFTGEKNDQIPIDISLLAQEKPRQYTLGAGDVIGVYVPGYVPAMSTDAMLKEVSESPPVHFPDREDTLPPSTGFPITVLEDETISLPKLDPIEVKGLTTDQVRDKIQDAYSAGGLTFQGKPVTPIVSLIDKRRINVVVIRQDQVVQSSLLEQVNRTGRGVTAADQSAKGDVVQLDAFENDILHALTETGGMPGVS
ncbi:MAG: polysaccharide biosynthesis/export family protein, partial [Planctomycetales bacterium]|nr:polysaccharide biosynthesis/export family protein [Planctomycetales bacterium]